MTNKTVFIFIMALLLFGCDKPSTNDETAIVGSVSFKLQKGERIFQAKGIDSDIRKIVLNAGDTLTIESGNSPFNLKEDYITVMSPQDKKEWETLAGKRLTKNYLIVSEKAEEETKYGIFLKNYYMYDTLSDIAVEIVSPKKMGIGTTGVYIPKLKDGTSFTMYGIDLDSSSHKEAMEIIRSIHYTK